MADRKRGYDDGEGTSRQGAAKKTATWAPGDSSLDTSLSLLPPGGVAAGRSIAGPQQPQTAVDEAQGDGDAGPRAQNLIAAMDRRDDSPPLVHAAAVNQPADGNDGVGLGAPPPGPLWGLMRQVVREEVQKHMSQPEIQQQLAAIATQQQHIASVSAQETQQEALHLNQVADHLQDRRREAPISQSAAATVGSSSSQPQPQDDLVIQCPGCHNHFPNFACLLCASVAAKLAIDLCLLPQQQPPPASEQRPHHRPVPPASTSTASRGITILSSGLQWQSPQAQVQASAPSRQHVAATGGSGTSQPQPQDNARVVVQCPECRNEFLNLRCLVCANAAVELAIGLHRLAQQQQQPPPVTANEQRFWQRLQAAFVNQHGRPVGQLLGGGAPRRSAFRPWSATQAPPLVPVGQPPQAPALVPDGQPPQAPALVPDGQPAAASGAVGSHLPQPPPNSCPYCRQRRGTFVPASPEQGRIQHFCLCRVCQNDPQAVCQVCAPAAWAAAARLARRRDP